MKLTFSIILSLSVIALHAQTVLTKATNAYIGTGKHVMQQVSPNSESKAGCWDFSNMEITSPKYIVWHVDRGDSLKRLTAVVERGASYRYCMQGDTLLVDGYRGRLSEITYDEREISLLLPMVSGDSIQGIFHGRGTYGDKMATRHYGQYKTKAVGTGTLLLPDNQSLRHILKVHTDRFISSKYYPITQLDSLVPYTSDSVAMQLRSDTAIIHASVDRWYAPGYRYPVIETRKIIGSGATSLLSQTLYYPTGQQESDCPDDEDNAKIRESTREDKQQEKTGDNPKQDISGNPPQITDIKVNVSGTTVNVSYSLLADANVTALICDVSGVVYRQLSQTGNSGDDHQMSINCNGLRRGQYVLYLNVNGQVVSQAVSL